MTTDDSTQTPVAQTDHRFERTVVLCLHAYPQPWRAVRSAELTAVLADLAGPSPRRLDARAAVGLIRGGWATRWREHPPLGAYLAYRLLDRRLPARYRAWVRADIGGALFPVRQVLTRATMMALIFAATPRVLARIGPAPRDGGAFEGVGIAVAVWVVMGAISLLFGRAWRDAAARRFLVLRAGDPVVEGDFIESLGPKQRLDARSWLTAATVVVSVAAAAWTSAAVVAPKVIGAGPCGPVTDDGSPWCTEFAARPAGSASTVLAVVLVAAGMIGLAAVRVVRRRLDRLIAAAPPQPHRELVGLSASTVVAVTVLSSGILAEAWLEATGRLVVLASGVLGPIAVLVLPGVVAAWLFVRASPEAQRLAGSDIVTMAVAGRVPEADRLRSGVMPVIGPVPPGAVMPAR